MPAVQNGKPDTNALRKLYGASNAAKAAFDYFAQRQYNSARTTVDRLLAALKQEGHDVARSDIVELFKALQSAGCGDFVIGRKGHPSRFEWTVGLADVGRSASGEPVKVEAISEAEKLETAEEEASAEMLEHRYRLRPDTELKISLPVNLTAAEATRIADFVRTLPFAS